MTDQHPRTIRSFVRRQGRMTSGQQAALDELLPRYGLPEQPVQIDFESVFGNSAPVILEIGFGNGESLAQQALDNPQQNYLGLEVHPPGVGHILMQIDQLGLDNLRVAMIDAVELVEQRLPEHSLAGVQIYFPDPWHKKRHNKRRLVQAAFVQRLKPLLQPDAVIHFASDWLPYAEEVQQLFNADPDFTVHPDYPDPQQRPALRPETKFERRGLKLGHVVSDLVYIYTG